MTTLTVYVQMFLNAKAGKAAGTQTHYIYVLNDLITHSSDAWPLTPEAIDAYIASLHRRQLAPGTIHGHWRGIRAFCIWLEKRGHITTNPIRLAEKPPLPKPLPRAVKEDVLQTAFAYLKAQAKTGNWLDVRNLAVFSLMLDAGLRNGELCSLELDDLDIDNRAVVLRDTKTSADGTSYFSDQTAEYLARWLEARSGLVIKCDNVFVALRHKPLTVSGVNGIFKELSKQAGVTHFTAHQLRHSCAVLSLREGAELTDVQYQLRHKSLQMTMRYLLVEDEGRRARVADFSPVMGVLQ